MWQRWAWSKYLLRFYVSKPWSWNPWNQIRIPAKKDPLTLNFKNSSTNAGHLFQTSGSSLIHGWIVPALDDHLTSAIVSSVKRVFHFHFVSRLLFFKAVKGFLCLKYIHEMYVTVSLNFALFVVISPCRMEPRRILLRNSLGMKKWHHTWQRKVFPWIATHLQP